jgi:glycosyltransferase involved in cell wall biosynthesis
MAGLVSVIVPVYNSEASLEELHRRLAVVLKSLCKDAYEIILVDDASRDRSAMIMGEIRDRDPKVKIIGLTRNFGQQNALFCGFHFAGGDYLITLDDDLQHPPEEIPRLLAKLAEGYDVVFGIPLAKRHAAHRNLGSRLIGVLLSLIAGKPWGIKVSSFRALRRPVVTEILKERRAFIYLAPLIFRATRRVAIVYVRHEPRKHGRSNYRITKLIGLGVKLIVNYSALARWFPAGNRPQYEIREIRQ